MDGEQLERAGERIVNLERLYNLAHGLGPGEDTLPSRFTHEVLDVGESAGETVDIERLVHDYYEARDWSPCDGHPSRAKLRELGLEQEYERLLYHLADT
jgi:aldehyde:ferredoxin oxidoreductase